MDITSSKFNMTPNGEGVNWPPVSIVCRIVYELVVKCSPDIAEKPGVIVGFQNFLMPIIQVAVPNDKAISTGFQKGTMVGRNAVNNSGDAGDVLGPFPSGTLE